MVGFSHVVHNTMVPVDKSCQARNYCSLPGSQLGKTDDYFKSTIALTSPSRTLKASH